MLELIKTGTSEIINIPDPKMRNRLPGIENNIKLSMNIDKDQAFQKPQSKTAQEKTDAKIEHIAQAMDSYVQSIQRKLQINVHQGTGELIVKVISKEDGKVIREIPSEELLDLASKMEEMMGVLFNESA